MTAIAALSLLDGQATPVAHTFSPVTIKDGIAWWADRSTGISVGFPTVTFSSKQPQKTANGSKNYKVTLKVTLPVLEQTSPSTGTGIQPAPTKGYDLIANLEFVLPERSTLAQRKDILAYAKNLMSNALVTAGVQDFETVFGA